MTGSTAAALFGTMFVLAIVPGPSDFAVVARSMSSGIGQGALMTAGIIAADLLFIVLAVYSLSIVAETMGALFVFVKYACGAYLVWMGVGLWRAPAAASNDGESPSSTSLSSFLSGFLITLGDPKAILFYMGLFPAFVDLSGVTLADTVTIMLVATAVVGGVKLTWAYLADRTRLLFENSRLRKVIDATAGTVLIGTGVFLLLRG